MKKKAKPELREGTKRLFPGDFDKFTRAAADAARENQLPMILELGNLRDYKLKDFEDLMNDFYRNTGLELNGLLSFSCSSGKMRAIIKVDWPDTEEQESLLQ